MEEEGMVTITEHEYERLLEDSKFLGALMAAGVDNWEGWDYALEMMEDEDG